VKRAAVRATNTVRRFIASNVYPVVKRKALPGLFFVLDLTSAEKNATFAGLF
jgi:hypothetical protein